MPQHTAIAYENAGGTRATRASDRPIPFVYTAAFPLPVAGVVFAAPARVVKPPKIGDGRRKGLDMDKRDYDEPKAAKPKIVKPSPLLTHNESHRASRTVLRVAKFRAAMIGQRPMTCGKIVELIKLESANVSPCGTRSSLEMLVESKRVKKIKLSAAVKYQWIGE